MTAKSNVECMRESYLLAARDLLDLAFDMSGMSEEREFNAADNVIQRLRGAMHAYRNRGEEG